MMKDLCCRITLEELWPKAQRCFICGNCVAVRTKQGSRASTGNVIGLARRLDLCREGKMVSDHSRYVGNLLKLRMGASCLNGLCLAKSPVQSDDGFLKAPRKHKSIYTYQP